MDPPSSWDSLRKQARKLEAQLDEQMNSYRKVVSSKADGTDSDLEPGIDRLLKQLEQVNSQMQAWVSSGGSEIFSHTLTRHQEILQDLTQEFYRLRSSLRAQKEHASLLQDFMEFDRTRLDLEEGGGSVEQALLKEHATISRSSGQDEGSSNGSRVESECIVDHTNIFTTDIIFQSRKELIEWTKNVGKRNGVVIVIQKSDGGAEGRKPRVTLGCERSGAYRSFSKEEDPPKKKRSKCTGTKKCGCPFLLKGTKLANDGDWMLKVVCGVHNHDTNEYIEGHSFAGRLSEEEIKIVVDMSKSQVRPKDILSTLKQRDVSNASTMKTIYNARHKYKVLEKGGIMHLQKLQSKLVECKYIEWHRSGVGNNFIKDLFWAHPSAVDLLRCFPGVLIMDCVYKRDKHRFVLLEIVGVTSTDLTFSVAFAYLESEREYNYKWALEKLKDLLHDNMMPHVIITDKDLALMRVVSEIFPKATNLLCRWCISKDILANCKRMFEKKEKWDTFFSLWNVIVVSTTEDEYLQHVHIMDRDYSAYPKVIEHVKVSWLTKYKERFVAAWTNNYMHFGNVTTNKAGNAHAKLKRHFNSFEGSFESSWMKICSFLELQLVEIKESFEKSLIGVQENYKPAIFNELRGYISKIAMDEMIEELKRIEYVGVDQGACECVIRKTHGLPCAHEIIKYQKEGQPMPLSCMHPHWRKLDLIVGTRSSTSKLSCMAEIEIIQKRFDDADEFGKREMLKKLKELANPNSTRLPEPDANMNSQGQSLFKLSASSCVDSSPFDYVSSSQDSLLPHTSTMSQEQRRQKESVYRTRSMTSESIIDQFPEVLRPYIQFVKNVNSDNNCGYRAIAALMGMGEDNWAQVRMDLITELNSFKDEYSNLYGGLDRLHELLHSLAYFEGYTRYDQSMIMPEMGHLIASRYNVVLIHLSRLRCLTFLPLRSVPIPLATRRIIVIGFVNENHFAQVFMTPGSPIPPVASNWSKFHYSCAQDWETPYMSRIEQFKDLVGLGVAMTEFP